MWSTIPSGRHLPIPYYRSKRVRECELNIHIELEVLELVAVGRTNAAVASRLVVAERTVEAHMRSILQKLQIPDTGDDHRRVLAVIEYLSR